MQKQKRYEWLCGDDRGMVKQIYEVQRYEHN